ncbi:hypothetical protein PMIN04_013171 [Paraphaeosphaeria minitans]
MRVHCGGSPRRAFRYMAAHRAVRHLPRPSVRRWAGVVSRAMKTCTPCLSPLPTYLPTFLYSFDPAHHHHGSLPFLPSRMTRPTRRRTRTHTQTLTPTPTLKLPTAASPQCAIHLHLQDLGHPRRSERAAVHRSTASHSTASHGIAHRSAAQMRKGEANPVLRENPNRVARSPSTTSGPPPLLYSPEEEEEEEEADE